MLRTAAICGERVICSSWKLEISRTTRSAGWISSRRSTSGMPMFPPTQALRGDFTAACAIRPTSVVVVVFPAEPVMPITGPGTASMKICVSFVRASPRRSASCTIGRVSGMPPERQTRSAVSSRRKECSPNTQLIERSAFAARTAAIWETLRWSFKVTCAPLVER